MSKIDDLIEARLAAKLDAVIEGAIERRLRAMLGADEPARPGKKAPRAPRQKANAQKSRCEPGRKRSRQRWTPEEDRKVIELARAGVARLEMARCLGRTTHATTQRLSYLREREGKSPRKGKPQGRRASTYTKAEIAEMAKLRESGESLRAIARAYDTHHATVRRLIEGAS